MLKTSSPHVLQAARLARWLISFEVFLVAIYWLDILLGEPFSLIHRLFDLDGEANIPTWFSSVQLLLIGFTLLLSSVCRKAGPPRPTVLLLAGCLFVVMSADEVIQLHEGITGILGSRYIEWLPSLIRSHYTAALGCVFLSTIPLRAVYPDIKALWSWSHKQSLLAVSGVCVFVIGAAVFESLGYKYIDSHSLTYNIEVAAEEFFEMLGATLILRATTALALQHLSTSAAQTEFDGFKQAVGTVAAATISSSA